MIIGYKNYIYMYMIYNKVKPEQLKSQTSVINADGTLVYQDAISQPEIYLRWSSHLAFYWNEHRIDASFIELPSTSLLSKIDVCILNWYIPI